MIEVKDYCSRCHSTDNLQKWSRQYRKNGSPVQYMMCRDCSTKRFLSYSKTEDGAKHIYNANKKYLLRRKGE